MQKVHLLCNAHIDPVWLWAKEEGVAETLSTFRVAASFCEAYDGFIFNHNEAVLYEWVEEHEPALFTRIQELVRVGKWHIMGGWYLQPDCLMPSAEGFLRQIEAGNRYFMEKFGVKPTTAINLDPFGHTRGLVQIMKKCGYDSYLFMRPGGFIPEHDFIWEGYDGSKLRAHCIRNLYCTHYGEAAPQLEQVLADPHTDPELMLWGIGDHGGGPSKLDLDAIHAIMARYPQGQIVHSTPESYMAQVDWDTVRTHSGSLQHIFVGCYTSMNRVKKAYRALENQLITTEKMLAAAGMEADLQEAEKALLFAQFHDILPGTMIKKGEDQTLQLLGFGSELLSRQANKAFFRLASGEPVAKEGEIPILVFNPHPYPVTQQIEAEFQLADQNWNDNQVTLAKVRDCHGRYLPAQIEQEDSHMNLDWRKKVVFTATLAPMSMNRFDCELYIVEALRRPIEACAKTKSHYLFDNGDMQVSVNRQTGLLDRLCVGGQELLTHGSAQIQAFRDHEDPWKMDNEIYDQFLGSFEPLSAEEANRFRGYPEAGHPNVQVIENGPARTKLQAILRHGNSFATVTYTLPKQGCYVDIRVHMLVNDVNTLYKLTFPTSLTDADFTGQTAYGTEPLRTDGQEVCFQKWCRLQNRARSFTVLNRSTYGGSARDGQLSISLLRTCVHSSLPIPPRPTTDNDRYHDHIDMGEHEFIFRLLPNTEHADAEAEFFNQPPFVLSFFPCGDGEKKDTGVELSNRNILMSSFRKRGDRLLLRLYNGSDAAQSTGLSLAGTAHTLEFAPFQAKAFVLEDGRLTETALSFL